MTAGISAATAIADARRALDKAIRDALADDNDVEIAFGFRSVFQKDDWISPGEIEVSVEPANIGPSRGMDERITFHVGIGAWRSGYDDEAEREAFDRAFGLLATIQEHIRQKDITLGGTVFWCVPGTVVSDGATTDADSGHGRVVELDATFVCAHRVRTLA